MKGLDHQLKTPGVHLLVECLCETLPAFGVLVHGSDIGLEDDLVRRGRTPHFRASVPVGRTPGSLARIADIMPQQKRVEPERGGLESPNGVCPRSAPIAAGFVFDRWNIHVRQHDAIRLSRAGTPSA